MRWELSVGCTQFYFCPAVSLQGIHTVHTTYFLSAFKFCLVCQDWQTTAIQQLNPKHVPSIMLDCYVGGGGQAAWDTVFRAKCPFFSSPLSMSLTSTSLKTTKCTAECVNTGTALGFVYGWLWNRLVRVGANITDISFSYLTLLWFEAYTNFLFTATNQDSRERLWCLSGWETVL